MIRLWWDAVLALFTWATDPLAFWREPAFTEPPACGTPRIYTIDGTKYSNSN